MLQWQHSPPCPSQCFAHCWSFLAFPRAHCGCTGVHSYTLPFQFCRNNPNLVKKKQRKKENTSSGSNALEPSITVLASPWLLFCIPTHYNLHFPVGWCLRGVVVAGVTFGQNRNESLPPELVGAIVVLPFWCYHFISAIQKYLCYKEECVKVSISNTAEKERYYANRVLWCKWGELVLVTKEFLVLAITSVWLDALWNYLRQ